MQLGNEVRVRGGGSCSGRGQCALSHALRVSCQQGADPAACMLTLMLSPAPCARASDRKPSKARRAFQRRIPPCPVANVPFVRNLPCARAITTAVPACVPAQDPDIFYTDRQGFRCTESLSLGIDECEWPAHTVTGRAGGAPRCLTMMVLRAVAAPVGALSVCAYRAEGAVPQHDHHKRAAPPCPQPILGAHLPTPPAARQHTVLPPPPSPVPPSLCVQCLCWAAAPPLRCTATLWSRSARSLAACWAMPSRMCS